MRALIDGDVLVYKCGFAAQKTIYHIFEGDREVPSSWVYCETKDNAKEAKEVLLDDATGNLFREPEIIVEDVSHALHNVRHMIERIMEETQCSDYRLILSGSGNYRETVDSTKPYKGNRDPEYKPAHYTAIKDYMYSHHPCEIANGMEGDDLMGIRQMESDGNTVICSIDKDMLMIPGLHYNIDLGAMIEQSIHGANLAFFNQLITGDATDNIPGVRGMGKGKATKLLSFHPPEEWWEVISHLYEQQYGDPWVIYEQAYLLWILRSLNEIEKPVQWWRLYE